jgi:hypothetical protein
VADRRCGGPRADCGRQHAGPRKSCGSAYRSRNHSRQPAVSLIGGGWENRKDAKRTSRPIYDASTCSNSSSTEGAAEDRYADLYAAAVEIEFFDDAVEVANGPSALDRIADLIIDLDCVWARRSLFPASSMRCACCQDRLRLLGPKPVTFGVFLTR